EGLIEQRLAQREQVGWSFVHPMVRARLTEGLEADARARLHLASARALERVGHGDADGERIGRHYLEAGQPHAAEAWLLAAAERCIQTSDFDRARRLLSLHGDALDALDAHPTDRRRVGNLRAETRLLAKAGALQECKAACDRLRALANSLDDDSVRADAALVSGLVALSRGPSRLASRRPRPPPRGSRAAAMSPGAPRPNTSWARCTRRWGARGTQLPHTASPSSSSRSKTTHMASARPAMGWPTPCGTWGRWPRPVSCSTAPARTWVAPATEQAWRGAPTDSVSWRGSKKTSTPRSAAITTRRPRSRDSGHPTPSSPASTWP